MSVLEALARHYDRLRARGEAPPYGFSRERISYAIVLCDAGEAVAMLPVSERSQTRSAPSLCEVPQAVRRTSRPAANFLWDNTAYVLGAKRDPVTRKACPAHREHGAFQALHEALLSGADDDGLQALLRFLRAWDPSDYGALPHAEAMLGSNFIFRLEGERDWLHERPAANRIWAQELAQIAPADGVCLVTGARGPIARVHPVIKGVWGTHAAGAALVTCNLATFESYGKIQGANAPISTQAAFAYASALNALLAFDNRQRIRIGDMTVVLWAETAGDDDGAEEAERLVSTALIDPGANALAASAVARTLDAIARGEPLAHATPQRPAGTRVHILGLAGNVGRISVRLWHVDTVGGLARRIVEHWNDLQIEPAPWRVPPPARRLLYEAGRQRKADQIPRALGPALLRAILNGTRYPTTLLGAVIARIRAEKAVTGAQAAICRACLARNHRLGFEREDAPVSLDRDEMHPAYRLGRLFAVYERVQRAALGTVNATIRDRYFGAASATPATVFPLLARKCAHHLATLRRAERSRGLAHWFEREMDNIFEGLESVLPRSLRLEEQGRFALGYHHQRTAKRASGHDAETADGDHGDPEA